jgi:hypothetical protein
VLVVNLVDLVLERHELLQLLLEVLQCGILGVESLQTLLDLLLPEPVVRVKAVQELLNIVLSSLDRTSKQENNLNNLFILSYPVIEWLSLVLWLVLLVPVLNVLG